MPTSQQAIAILGDEPAMRKALRRLLGSRGFCAKECEPAEDFLAPLDSPRPVHVWLDLHMPGLYGFDVLEAFPSRQISFDTNGLGRYKLCVANAQCR
jgi:FixJ family two-component response regulator